MCFIKVYESSFFVKRKRERCSSGNRLEKAESGKEEPWYLNLFVGSALSTSEVFYIV